MYAVAGATGRVGSATARHLLADGAEVRVLVRDRRRVEEWMPRAREPLRYGGLFEVFSTVLILDRPMLLLTEYLFARMGKHESP